MVVIRFHAYLGKVVASVCMYVAIMWTIFSVMYVQQHWQASSFFQKKISCGVKDIMKRSFAISAQDAENTLLGMNIGFVEVAR